MAGKNENIKFKIETLTLSIVDAYKRMATNEDKEYREQQMIKVEYWLNELTSIHNKYPNEWIASEFGGVQ